MFKLNITRMRKTTLAQFTKARAYLAVEFAGAAAILVAIAHYSWPGALALGGLTAIVAVERQNP